MATLALAGLVAAISVWWLGHQASVPGPATSASSVASVASVASASPARSAAAVATAGVLPTPNPPVTPTSLRIPGIGVATGLDGLGLNADGTVEVPGNPDVAGWFSQGTVPGQPGSSVILGHVDSVHGPAVFSRLHELGRGDRILVRLSDGTTTRFTVARVVTYPNAEFPAQRVYAGTPRRATLSLVTCGGAYDADAGGYQANVVVYTRGARTS